MIARKTSYLMVPTWFSVKVVFLPGRHPTAKFLKFDYYQEEDILPKILSTFIVIMTYSKFNPNSNPYFTTVAILNT